MAQPVLLPPAFDGMAQDFPRNAMPKGKAWNLVDYIPTVLGAPATERGGWSYASPSLTAVDASATYVKAVAYVPFSAGAQLLAINDTGNLCKITSSTVASLIGAALIPKQNPVFLNNLLVIPSPDGTTAPKKYDGTTIAALGASAPSSQYAAVFINRVWMANSVAEPQRVYASDPLDATSWDQTQQYLDASGPITGLCALPSVLLAFTSDKAIRFRGTTPPPGSDMIEDDPIFNFGCTDARSIAVNGSVACFANPTGVFLTNGTAFPTDLTQACGIKQYWRSLLSTYSASTWTLAGGWFGNLYYIAVMNGSTFVDAIVFDTKMSMAYRISNLDADMLASSVQAGTELYAASRGEARVYALSSMFTPGASFKNDADGTPVTGVWESPFYEAKQMGMQRWRDVYLERDLRDAASDSPTMTVSYVLSPESASYTDCTPTLAATTAKKTDRRPVYKANSGMGFKVSRTNSAASAKLYALGATLHALEGSKRIR